MSISFIVIGKNEGWKITKCFQSIIDTIFYNKLTDYEVIYIDSNSSDDSIKRVLEFKDVKIFKITSKPNAAIARNIGAQESNGEALFFIDGDMEIIPDFLLLVYNEKDGLKFNFVSGQFINYYYDVNWNYIDKKEYQSLKNGDYNDVVTGGLFCIKKDIWFRVGGMNNKYKRSQDFDLGLRLAKKGIKLLRKKELMGIHHMISYFNKKRMWGNLFKGFNLYGRSLLYREHFFNKAVFSLVRRQDYSLIMMIILGVILILKSSIYPLAIYVLVILMKSIKNSDKNQRNMFHLFFYYTLRDIIVFLGFFLFFPAKISNNEIQYKLIKAFDISQSSC